MSGLLVLMAGIPSAQAQTHSTADPSVTISGTVLDTSGAVIPNAEIKLTAVETSVATTASDQGQFSIHTKPGDYVLKVSSLGFRPYELSIHVASSSEEQLRVILQVGGGCSVCFEENIPPAPILNASLSSTIPLQSLPPLPLHRKSLKRLPR
ncbi:carboxypeptidase-like regulatory domain-containing protein [Edaphobacter modestus]|uniref:Carboxypeptidase family protein n=1 Tax=Edaphobacter modestus TaxID=388466 RepID=A0A4Q7Z0A4_9BACT|nr:carboxypeptidase-like regulatory domain-containing protein [Edaphobacter modestus]RZU42885.1 carboxypeptidase family protein [Edaphobacter modestus]